MVVTKEENRQGREGIDCDEQAALLQLVRNFEATHFVRHVGPPRSRECSMLSYNTIATGAANSGDCKEDQHGMNQSESSIITLETTDGEGEEGTSLYT